MSSEAWAYVAASCRESKQDSSFVKHDFLPVQDGVVCASVSDHLGTRSAHGNSIDLSVWISVVLPTGRPIVVSSGGERGRYPFTPRYVLAVNLGKSGGRGRRTIKNYTNLLLLCGPAIFQNQKLFCKTIFRSEFNRLRLVSI